ncbi:MAG: hypothetical protein J6T01_04445 [Kiritimatiellae bacterium]|nr:hypothetical protein [Kiritimatiellia bacterium]
MNRRNFIKKGSAAAFGAPAAGAAANYRDLLSLPDKGRHTHWPVQPKVLTDKKEPST